jgi:hypothetical protein
MTAEIFMPGGGIAKMDRSGVPGNFFNPDKTQFTIVTLRSGFWMFPATPLDKILEMLDMKESLTFKSFLDKNGRYIRDGAMIQLLDGSFLRGTSTKPIDK